jgi:hypothetical protein
MNPAAVREPRTCGARAAAGTQAVDEGSRRRVAAVSRDRSPGRILPARGESRPAEEVVRSRTVPEDVRARFGCGDRSPSLSAGGLLPAGEEVEVVWLDSPCAGACAATTGVGTGVELSP